MKIEFLRFSSSAITPTQGTKDSPGFDLYSVENVIVPANYMKIIKTDIVFKILRGYFGKIYARSSLAIRCTEVSGDVIDSYYRDLVSPIFFNFSKKSIETEKGNRFCQIVFHKIANQFLLREVDKFEDKTDRGEGSFGTTNKKFYTDNRVFTYRYDVGKQLIRIHLLKPDEEIDPVKILDFLK